MPSQGLMIGAGIGQGLLAMAQTAQEQRKLANDERRIALEDERNRRMDRYQQGGLLMQANKEGYTFDPETGTLTETPEGRENRLAELMVKKARARYYDSARGTAANDKRIRQIETDTRMLSDKLSPTQDAIGSLSELDSTMGFPLDSAEVKDGKLMVGGKERDLPGVTIPGIGRVSAYSGEARNLQSAAAKVFNSVLKDRSGAAVTNPELARLKEEFNQGKFNTEPEIITALQRYKRGVAMEMKNREAGFSQEAVDQYAKRGGTTSRGLMPKTQSVPEVETKEIDGVTYKKVPGGWEEVVL